METGMNALYREVTKFTTLYPNYVSTLPDKTKNTHKTAHFEVKRRSILLLNSKNESMS